MGSGHRASAHIEPRGQYSVSLLASLEGTAFSEWVLISMLGFPTLIALHSVGMGVAVGLSLIVTLRLNRVITGIDARLLPRLLTVAVSGFVLNLITGLALFVSRGTEYIASGIFLLKMLLVIVSAAILFWLRRHLIALAQMPDGEAVDSSAKQMSVVFTVTWFCAVITGRLIAYLSDLY